MSAAVFCAGFGAFLGFKSLGSLATVDIADVVTASAVVGFFTLIAAANYRAAYAATARYAVIPRTSVTSAFEFSDNQADMFEPEHRLYFSRNEHFAQGLEVLNQDRIWHPGGRAAQAAVQKRNVLYVVLAIGAAVILSWDLIANFLDHL